MREAAFAITKKLKISTLTVPSPVSRLCDELLKRRDPSGYYIILAKPEALPLLQGVEALVEQSPSLLVVRVKSRSLARKICMDLLEKNLLVSL